MVSITAQRDGVVPLISACCFRWANILALSRIFRYLSDIHMIIGTRNCSGGASLRARTV